MPLQSAPFRIIVKLHDNLGLTYPEEEDIAGFFLQQDIIPWHHWSMLFPGITIHRLFTSTSTAAIRQLAAKAVSASANEYKAPDFGLFFAITCPSLHNPAAVLQTIQQCEYISFAYLQNNIHKPPSIAASLLTGIDQGYLNPAPEGINAKYAWTFAGGDGAGNVTFIDIEQGWGLHHRALRATTLPCTGFNSCTFEDHGTAVLGLISMHDTENGRKGIAPKASGYVVSVWRPDDSFNIDDAIMAAINELNAGDILLLQSQAFDPYDSLAAWPVEINEASFEVIRLATALGIIVIEPSGNGSLQQRTGNDLDLYMRHQKHILHPSSPHFRDSGAVMVAACCATPPYTRVYSSNFGQRINCFAHGEKVVTAGGYPGPSGFATNLYTGVFGGTSSASAIIAGAAVVIQSIAEAHSGTRLTPTQLRAILSHDLYGTPSLNGRAVDKTGVMPDLQKIISPVLNMASSLRLNKTTQH